MKFKTSALAMTATVAVGLMSSAFAEETSYDKLGFSTNQTYSVTVSGSTITTSTKSTLLPTPTAKDGVIEIDSDETEPLRFTPATANAVNDATELKFNVEASVVPNSVTLTNDTSAQCGFAIKETIENDVSTTNFHVFTGSAWQKISNDVEIPAAGTMFDLTVKLDYRTGFGKAQYLVDGVALGDGAWYSIKSGSQKVSYIDFIGNGKLASLRGDVLQVASEIIPINPTGSKNVEVKFSEEQLAALKKAVGGDLTAVVSAMNDPTSQANGNKAFDNYILFNKVTGATAADVPVVKADPAAASEDNVNNVVVTVPTLAIQIVEGVTVTHKLMGSATGADGSWTQVGDAQTGANPQFEIPHDSTNRYFKVETAVSTTGVVK